MVPARYEVRVNCVLSDRARAAFCGMNVRPVPPQTIVSGELTDQFDLGELLALCMTMGLEVVSIRQLPAETTLRKEAVAIDGLGPGSTRDTAPPGEPGRSLSRPGGSPATHLAQGGSVHGPTDVE